MIPSAQATTPLALASPPEIVLIVWPHVQYRTALNSLGVSAEERHLTLPAGLTMSERLVHTTNRLSKLLSECPVLDTVLAISTPEILKKKQCKDPNT